MNQSINLFLLLAMTSLWSCNQDPNSRLTEGQIAEDTYTNERFGLEVEMPAGWRVVTQVEQGMLKREGAGLIEEEFGDNRSDTWTILLHLQKGISLNALMINYSLYRPELHGDSYAASKETRFTGMKKVLENNPGVQVESVRTVAELDGVEFDTYNMMIRKGSEVKGYQILLEKKFDNDEVLLLSLTADDREPLEEMRALIEGMKIGRKE